MFCPMSNPLTTGRRENTRKREDTFTWIYARRTNDDDDDSPGFTILRINVRIYLPLFLFKQRVWHEVVPSAYCHCRHLSAAYFVSWQTGVSLSPGRAGEFQVEFLEARGCGLIAREHAKSTRFVNSRLDQSAKDRAAQSDVTRL